MTAEKILDKICRSHGSPFRYHNDILIVKYALQAMEEYAMLKAEEAFNAAREQTSHDDGFGDIFYENIYTSFKDWNNEQNHQNTGKKSG